MASHALAHDHGAEHNPIAHVATRATLLTVFALLVGLTFLTVWQGTQLELGRLELVIVLVIATIKASLVVLYFMHLRYDRPLNVLVFLASLLFLGLFLGGTLTDAYYYQPDVSAKEADSASP